MEGRESKLQMFLRNLKSIFWGPHKNLFLWRHFIKIITCIVLEKCKKWEYVKNAIWLKIFCYKVFVHWKVKLLNFLMDSVLNSRNRLLWRSCCIIFMPEHRLVFYVVWSVPAKVFLTVTFSIFSILTDHDLFGSDVEQDCSFTVFAVVFYLN